MRSRLRKAWNAFIGWQPSPTKMYGQGEILPSFRGWGTGHSYSKSKFVSSIYNRIAIDVAGTIFELVKIDPKNEDRTVLKDKGLNNILNLEANIDQTAFQFKHDICVSLFDEGSIAVIPIETDFDPADRSGSVDYISMRTAKILQWFPEHIEVEAYDERDGRRKTIRVPKRSCAILENPLMSTMSRNNGTLNRLLSKIGIVDNLDKVLSSGRLDVLIQLPYVVKSDKRREAVKDRLKSIEEDLENGSNGIAYIEGTEKVIQLNRPANTQVVENAKLLKQEFFAQLGMTENIINGTASELEMRTYYTRWIDPIVSDWALEFTRKFVSKTARSQGQQVTCRRNMFSFVPVETIASLGDTFVRNRITTPNEIRKLIGLPPHSDPSADMLYNPNMPQGDQPGGGGKTGSASGQSEEISDYDKKVEREKIRQTVRDQRRNGAKHI